MYHCFAGPGEYKGRKGHPGEVLCHEWMQKAQVQTVQVMQNRDLRYLMRTGLKSSEPCLALSETLIKLAHSEYGATQATSELSPILLTTHLQRLRCCWRVSESSRKVGMLDRRSSSRDRRHVCVSMSVLAWKVNVLVKKGKGGAIESALDWSALEIILVFHLKPC